MNITRPRTTLRRTAGLCAVATSLLLAGCSTSPSAGEGPTDNDVQSAAVDGSAIALTSNQRLDDGVDPEVLFDTARRAMETVLSFEPGPDSSEADALERARPFLTDELANSTAAQPRPVSGLWQMVSDAHQQVSTRCYGGQYAVPEDAVTMAVDLDCRRLIHSADIAEPDNDPAARTYDTRQVRVRVTDTGHGIRVSSYTP
jgi:predicted small secreted protein